MTESKELPSLLIVEDDPSVAALLQHHFRRAGMAVEHASTLAAARSLLATKDFDLALLDRQLPDGDGVELAAETRAARPHVYILILTGCATEEAKLEGFELGADDYVTKPFQMQELLARVRAGLRIVELQKALLASNRRLEELSLTDGLTSLRNRRAFEQEFRARFEQARRYNRPLSVAAIDVDHFKSINDRFGHQAGDTVLRCVARVLASGSRQADFVARIGGEEFAVVLPETPLLEALQFAEKMRATLASTTIKAGGTPHHVTMSMGVASIPYSKVDDAELLLRAADEALYRAKANGRNRVEIERRRERERPAGGPGELLRAS